MTGETQGAPSPAPPIFSKLVTSDEFHPPQIPEAMANLHINLARGLPNLRVRKPTARPMFIVAGGPSLKETFPELLRRLGREPKPRILAVNDVYDWLYERGVVADYFAMKEVAPWPKEFLRYPRPQTEFLMSSLSNPMCFDRLKGFNVTLWHAPTAPEKTTKAVNQLPGYCEAIVAHDPHAIIVGGGEAISIMAINLGYALGHRRFEMFGVDGCYPDDPEADSHVCMNRRPRGVCKIRVGEDGRVFDSHYYLARQADDLRRVCLHIGHMFRLKCHGDGLVQHVHRLIAPHEYEDGDGRAAA